MARIGSRLLALALVAACLAAATATTQWPRYAGEAAEFTEAGVGSTREQMMARIAEAWSTLGPYIENNFGYHSMSHNINFAKAAVDLNAPYQNEYDLVAFTGGLLHDSGYLHSVEFNGYQPICVNRGPSGWWFNAPLAEPTTPRGAGSVNAASEHVKSNVGHEEFSVCWALKLIKEIKTDVSPSRDQVTKDLQAYWTLEKLSALIDAIMHTKFYNCVGAGCNPARGGTPTGAVFYAASNWAVEDVASLTSEFGTTTPITKHFPAGLQCQSTNRDSTGNAVVEEYGVFPLCKVLGSCGQSTDGGVTFPPPAGVSPAVPPPSTTHQLPLIFENADFAQAYQTRAPCTSMSLLHEIMAYETMPTFSKFPSTLHALDNVLMWLYGRAPLNAAAADRNAETYLNFNEFGPLVIAYMTSQPGFFNYGISYKALANPTAQEMLNRWTKGKEVQTKLFNQIVTEMVALGYPNLDRAAITALWGDLAAQYGGASEKQPNVQAIKAALCGETASLPEGRAAPTSSQSEEERSRLRVVPYGGVSAKCEQEIARGQAALPSALTPATARKILEQYGCTFINVPRLVTSDGQDSIWSGRYDGPEDAVPTDAIFTTKITAVMAANYVSPCQVPNSGPNSGTLTPAGGMIQARAPVYPGPAASGITTYGPPAATGLQPFSPPAASGVTTYGPPAASGVNSLSPPAASGLKPFSPPADAYSAPADPYSPPADPYSAPAVSGVGVYSPAVAQAAYNPLLGASGPRPGYGGALPWMGPAGSKASLASPGAQGYPTTVPASTDGRPE